MLVRIPRTATARGERTYARLVAHVYADRAGGLAFEGTLLRCGAAVEEAALRPSPEYPATPLVLEYAGSDHTGRGHTRSNDIYVLWRYAGAGEWRELVRTLSQGLDWVAHMRPAALAELGTDASHRDAAGAAAMAERILAALDREIERLEASERSLALGLLYEQFSARVAMAMA